MAGATFGNCTAVAASQSVGRSAQLSHWTGGAMVCVRLGRRMKDRTTGESYGLGTTPSAVPGARAASGQPAASSLI